MRATLPVTVALVGLVAVIWYAQSKPSDAGVATHRESPGPAATVIDRVESPAEPQSPPSVEPPDTVLVAAPPPALPDEGALMSTLRQLGDSSPQASLEMARAGNARFPDSPDAAERAWYVCKSLVNLENFYDARDEARLMVAKYPGTPWADDVRRHLLVNPLDLPGDPPP